MADPSPELLAADLASFLRNSPAELKALRKRMDDLQRDLAAHEQAATGQAKQLDALGPEITKTVQAARNRGMSGAKLSDFSSDPAVGKLLKAVVELQRGAVARQAATAARLTRDFAELTRDTEKFNKLNKTEHAYQTKLGTKAKWVGFNRGKLDEFKTLIGTIDKFAKEMARSLGPKISGLADYARVQTSAVEKTLSAAMWATRSDPKAVAANAFAGLDFDHKRLARNATAAKQLFDGIVETAKQVARFKQAGGNEKDRAALEAAIKTALQKEAAMAKLAALHAAEAKKLGSAGLDAMKSQPEGRKSLDLLATLADQAEKSAKLAKSLRL